MRIGSRLRVLRRSRLMTQAELAKKAQVSKQTIIRLESSGLVARFSTIRKLATALEVSPDDLIQGSPDSRRARAGATTRAPKTHSKQVREMGPVIISAGREPK